MLHFANSRHPCGHWKNIGKIVVECPKVRGSSGYIKTDRKTDRRIKKVVSNHIEINNVCGHTLLLMNIISSNILHVIMKIII